MSVSMFAVGFVIFAVYMYFTIWNINRGCEPIDEIDTDHHKADVMDMDGMGNFSRFPENIKTK